MVGHFADVNSRVKLPKSFLAVNLSENHTFHKKDDPSNDALENQLTSAEELTGEPLAIDETRQSNLSPILNEANGHVETATKALPPGLQDANLESLALVALLPESTK